MTVRALRGHSQAALAGHRMQQPRGCLRHAAETARARILRSSPASARRSRSRARSRPISVTSADKLCEHAEEEWQSNDLDECRRDALMAQVKLKTALALHEQDQLKARIQVLSGQEAQAEEELASLVEGSGQRKREAGPAAEVRGGAQDGGVREAAALPADDERAGEGRGGAAAPGRRSCSRNRRLAPRSSPCGRRTPWTPPSTPRPSTGPPATCWRRRKPTSSRSDYAGAQASAEVAEKSAQKAIEVSKPLYEQAEQASESKARNDALARDAAAIVGCGGEARTPRRSAAAGLDHPRAVLEAAAADRARARRRARCAWLRS